MTSPILAIGVGTVAIISMGLLLSLSGDQMALMLTSADSMDTENMRMKENLHITLSDDRSGIDVHNNWDKNSRIKEILVLDTDDNVKTRKFFEKNTSSETESQKDDIRHILSPALDQDRTVTAFKTKTIQLNTFGAANPSEEQIRIVTELGNVFTLEYDEDSQKDDETVNGMGLSSRIIQHEYDGRITYGQGVIGKDVSLKPYETVDSAVDFASIILTDDRKTIHLIPDFGAKYDFVQGVLQNTSEKKPNILSYSQSRTINGAGTATIDDDGITVSGTGTVIMRIDDSLKKNTLFLHGDATGGTVKIVESPYDLISLPYENGRGFLIHETTSGSDTQISVEPRSSGGRGWCCIYWTDYTHQVSFPVNKLFSSEQNVDAKASYSTSWKYWVEPCRHCSGGYWSNTISSGGSVTLEKSGQEDPSSGTYGLDFGSFQYMKSSKQYFFDITYAASFYDRGIPAASLLEFGAEFEKPYLLDSENQLYLVAQPNGGNITIKGETHDVSKSDFLQVSGLPANTPYQISDDGFVGTTGMTSAGGTIAISSSQIVSLDSDPGGMLYLYPDSMSYRGPFSTVVFDEINQQTIHIDSEDDKIYTVHAWVQIPVIGSVSVTDVSLDETVDMSYLDGDYQNGQYLRVPVIPGFKTIHMQVNGIPATIAYSDVLGGTGIRIASPVSSTITEYDAANAIDSIEATTGTTAFAIATSEGKLRAIVNAQVSGDSVVTNTITLDLPPPPPSPPRRADPLSAWVDVYKNGAFVKKTELFFDDTPDFTPSAMLDARNLRYTQSATYQYDQYAVSGNLEIDVLPGDFVEVYLHARIHADGIAVQVPSGFVMKEVTSQASATVNIHSGSISTSM